MAFCVNCGNALEEHQRFCPKCGTRVADEVTATPPPAFEPPGDGAPTDAPAAPPSTAAAGNAAPAAYAAPPDYAAPAAYAAPPEPPAPRAEDQQYGYAPAPQWAPPQRRGGRKGLWIGLGALVVAIAVACGLVFGVFKDDIFGGGSAGSPEQAVRSMLSAMENKDAGAILDLIDPAALEELEALMPEGGFEDVVSEGLFEYDAVKFSGIELDTEQTSETTATVTIVSGTVSMTDDGETETEDVSEAGEPVTFGLVKSDGSWYLDPYSMDMF